MDFFKCRTSICLQTHWVQWILVGHSNYTSKNNRIHNLCQSLVPVTSNYCWQRQYSGGCVLRSPAEKCARIKRDLVPSSPARPDYHLHHHHHHLHHCHHWFRDDDCEGNDDCYSDVNDEKFLCKSIIMTNSFWTNLIHTRLTLFLQKAFVADTYKPHKVKKKKNLSP